MANSHPLLPDASKPLNLKPVSASSPSSPPIHSRPNPTAISPWQFTYTASPDGHESNLMIMFHGLGDTEKSFAELGARLKLPGTCVMSVRGLFPIPMMDFPSFSWFPLDFSASYAPTPPPNPATLLPKLIELISYLGNQIGWDLERIHLFGWGEGGSAVLELAREVGMKGIKVVRSIEARADGNKGATEETRAKRFGSATSICGPLLSTPSVSAASLNLPTPILYFHRPRTSSSAPPSALPKTFLTVHAHVGTFDRSALTDSLRGDQPPTDGRMLTGETEWRGVMKFWGEVLAPKEDGGWMKGLRGKDGLGEMYEVVR